MTRVAVFRPRDERLTTAVRYLEEAGVEPVVDPMLEVDPTGATPREDADYVVFTSKTAAAYLDDWTPGDSVVCAIGPRTAAALRDVGIAVDIVPETYSSQGLVAALRDRVGGATVEVARSDHGSATLLEGLDAAGAYHHETVLYRLVRPSEAGDSIEMAAGGELAAALFTSSLTVEYFLEAAAEAELRTEAVRGLNAAVVGAIGTPTHDTATEAGIAVDVVPEAATFEALADAVLARLSTPDSV